MSETFQNAPLVEIIAVLAWKVPQLTAADQAGHQRQLPLVAADNKITTLFYRVTAALAKRGFDDVEPLGPSGMPTPVLLPQMMYRYRRKDNVPVLAQIGPGIFSVNALPPYKSWDEFRPRLVEGISGLLEALTDRPQLSISLRYVDAFKQDLSSGYDALRFSTDVLGFHFQPPETLRRRIDAQKQESMSFQVTIPTSDMTMNIAVSDGRSGGPASVENIVLMNTDVRVNDAPSNNEADITSAFDRAHNLIHDVFFELTRTIHAKMRPTSQEEDA